MGSIALGEGQFEEAQPLMRESIALRQRIGDRSGVARGYQILGLTLGLSGKPDPLRSLLEDSVAIWRDLGARTALPFATVLLAAAKMFSGEYEQARTEVRAALSLAQETGDQYALGHARLLLGAIALAQEAYAEADRWFRESLTSFTEIGQQTEIGVAFGFLGCAARGQGDLDRAEQLFFKALRTAVKLRSFLPAMPALPGAALLLADWGEEERAIEFYALLSHYPAMTDLPWSADIAGRHIAAVAAALPPEADAAARERGRSRDPEVAVAELLIELAAARFLPKALSSLKRPLIKIFRPLLMAVSGRAK
jgi:tetratricopeptide (TPR) repeat protein